MFGFSFSTNDLNQCHLLFVDIHTRPSHPHRRSFKFKEKYFSRLKRRKTCPNQPFIDVSIGNYGKSGDLLHRLQHPSQIAALKHLMERYMWIPGRTVGRRWGYRVDAAIGRLKPNEIISWPLPKNVQKWFQGQTNHLKLIILVIRIELWGLHRNGRGWKPYGSYS